MDYIQSRAAGLLDDAQEKIDKAKEEHGEPRIIHHYQDDSKTVKSGDSTQDMVDMSHTSPMQKTETTAGTEASYVRELGFKRTKAGISLNVPSDFKGASDVKNRLKEIRMVNEELERMGQKRRYKASESDIPDNAHMHKDNFGKYYYKSLSVDVRPSDVADFAGVKHHGSLSKTEKAANTVELFHELHSPAIKDATSFNAADSWLNRHMVLSDEAPASSDTFSHSFKEDIAAAISDTNKDSERDSRTKEQTTIKCETNLTKSMTREYKFKISEEQVAKSNKIEVTIDDRGLRKGRIYIDNPNEAPDDVSVQEGAQGGFYYETSGMDDLDAEMPESISDAGFDEVEVRNLVGRVEDEVGPREDVAEAAAEGLRDFTDGDFDELREYTEEVYDQMQENTEMPDAIEDAGFSEDQVEGFLQRVAAENEDVDDLAYRAASGVLELVGEDVDLDEVEEYFQRVYQDMDV